MDYLLGSSVHLTCSQPANERSRAFATAHVQMSVTADKDGKFSFPRLEGVMYRVFQVRTSDGAARRIANDVIYDPPRRQPARLDIALQKR